jgi:H+/gluconate symporter-like permease
MSFIVAIAALCFLMLAAYRGFSVILFAPIAALLAVLITEPSYVLPVYSGLFMDKMVIFVKLYFPVFLLGAIFGKVIELSGFSRSIVSATIRLVGREQAVLAIVIVCALLTYGGVSLFVVVFAVYPFAAEAFRIGGLPKRLIPGTIALGAFTFTMDSLPGTPQIQNIIPAAFFKTNSWSAPWLGLIGACYIAAAGLAYLTWRLRRAAAAGETYGEGHTQEPETVDERDLPNPLVALLPLVVVGVMNLVFTYVLPMLYGPTYSVTLAGLDHPLTGPVASNVAIWAVELALLSGILTVFATAFRPVTERFAIGSKAAVAGALLASLNTATEYGFGSVIAALPGFIAIRDALTAIPNPLVNEAISVTTLAGVTVGPVHRGCECRPYSARRAAPGGGDGLRGDGHAAAQWCGHYFTGGDRPDPSAVLQGYLRADLHQDIGSVRGDRGVLPHRHRIGGGSGHAPSCSASVPAVAADGAQRQGRSGARCGAADW